MRLLGTLEENEKSEIEEIYYRRVTLENMILVLQERGNMEESGSESLYQRLVQDMSETIKRMQDWWNKTSTYHGWEYRRENNWEVKFDSGEVYLHDSM